jgi:hypothetical protein
MKSFNVKCVLFLLFIPLFLIATMSCVSFGDPKYSVTKVKTVITVFEATSESLTPDFAYVTVTFKIKYLEYSSISFIATALDTNGKKYSDIGPHDDMKTVTDAVASEKLAAFTSKYKFFDKDMTDGAAYFVVPKAEKLKTIMFGDIGPLDISSIVKSK